MSRVASRSCDLVLFWAKHWSTLTLNLIVFLKQSKSLNWGDPRKWHNVDDVGCFQLINWLRRYSPSGFSSRKRCSLTQVSFSPFFLYSSMYCYWFIGIIGYKAKTIKWRRPFIRMPQHCSDTPAERAAALSGSCPGSFPWFIIHVSGLCFSVQITLLISFGEVVLMIWSSLLIIAYNLLLFPGFKRDVILNRWHCTLSARSHPEHQMFFLFFFSWDVLLRLWEYCFEWADVSNPKTDHQT